MKQFITGIIVLFASTAFAGNHADYVGSGPFKDGPSVTKKCLECHEKEGQDVLKTSHWQWGKKQIIHGKEVFHGKKNAINGFCLGTTSNRSRCTPCHIGYGWKDEKFNHNDPTNIDCLVCHDNTGTYKKKPGGAGHPAYVEEKVGSKVIKAVDLVAAAQSVGKPTRKNCITCHANGGGGDNVKHSDLSTSLIKPSPELDVHMGKLGFVCQTCHTANHDHVIKGDSIFASTLSKPSEVTCEKCHTKPHKNNILNRHTSTVSCQTCHIPKIAINEATIVGWDWSTAGQNLEGDHEDDDGNITYDKTKGSFTWKKNFNPTYLWWNGTTDRVLMTDKIDPSKPVDMLKLNGGKGNGKIYPFKVLMGKQVYDTEYSKLLLMNMIGPDGYWTKFDYQLSIKNGMKAINLPYSGKYGFVQTRSSVAVNHFVAPKEKALKCFDCHGNSATRIDWKGMGYTKDPLIKQ